MAEKKTLTEKCLAWEDEVVKITMELMGVPQKELSDKMICLMEDFTGQVWIEKQALERKKEALERKKEAPCQLNDDGSATVFNDEYTLEDMQHFVWDSICPAYCSACKEHVGDFEPDAYNYDCHDGCGSKGTVSSILILVGIC